MPSESRDISKIRARLYQMSTGNSGYEGRPLEQAREAGGPDLGDYAKVLDAYLETGPGKNIPAQLSQAFQEKADAKRPLDMSDILILSSSATGTNAYYLDKGSVWKHVGIGLAKITKGADHAEI